MNVSSPDISVFDFEVDFDLTTSNPFIKITNLSTGDNLAALKYMFICKSASGIAYYTGSWATPDKTGVWTTYIIPEKILQILGHIEWSGTEHEVIGYVMDSADTVFSLSKTGALCKPPGNKGGDNYGAGKVDVEVRCGDKKIYVADITNYSYRGSEGVEVSKTATLIYPPDQTGVQPEASTYTNFATSLYNIPYSSPNYQFILESIHQYDLGNGVRVKIKYKVKHFFAVLCNIDLCPLACEITKMIRNLSREGCTGAEREKVLLLNALLNQAIIAKMQPLCGIDLVSLVDEIKEIGGFTCNCCYGDGVAPTGNDTITGDSCTTANLNSINIS